MPTPRAKGWERKKKWKLLTVTAWIILEPRVRKTKIRKRFLPFYSRENNHQSGCFQLAQKGRKKLGPINRATVVFINSHVLIAGIHRMTTPIRKRDDTGHTYIQFPAAYSFLPSELRHLQSWVKCERPLTMGHWWSVATQGANPMSDHSISTKPVAFRHQPKMGGRVILSRAGGSRGIGGTMPISRAGRIYPLPK